jgi:predicted CopG family antitoxin
MKTVHISDAVHAQLKEMQEFYVHADGKRISLSEIIRWGVRDRFDRYLDDKKKVGDDA